MPISALLTESEQAFFRALGELNVRYLMVGMSAALAQGVRGATEDLDLWFENLSDPHIGDAARKANGFWVTRAEPPMLGGMSERIDVVTTMSGLPVFADEFARAKSLNIDGIAIPVLPLERILLSKRTANRPKDRLAVQAIEIALAVLSATDAPEDA